MRPGPALPRPLPLPALRLWGGSKSGRSGEAPLTGERGWISLYELVGFNHGSGDPWECSKRGRTHSRKRPTPLFISGAFSLSGSHGNVKLNAQAALVFFSYSELRSQRGNLLLVSLSGRKAGEWFTVREFQVLWVHPYMLGPTDQSECPSAVKRQ